MLKFRFLLKSISWGKSAKCQNLIILWLYIVIYDMFHNYVIAVNLSDVELLKIWKIKVSDRTTCMKCFHWLLVRTNSKIFKRSSYCCWWKHVLNPQLNIQKKDLLIIFLCSDSIQIQTSHLWVLYKVAETYCSLP